MKTKASPSGVVPELVIRMPSARVEEGSRGIAKGDGEYSTLCNTRRLSFVRNAANNQLHSSVIVAAHSRLPLPLPLLPSQLLPVRVL